MEIKHKRQQPHTFGIYTLAKFCDTKCAMRRENRCVAAGQDLFYVKKCPQIRELSGGET